MRGKQSFECRLSLRRRPQFLCFISVLILGWFCNVVRSNQQQTFRRRSAEEIDSRNDNFRRSNGWSTNSRYSRAPPSNGGSWDEEQLMAMALQLKVIRKLSLKKWIRERHTYWPNRPNVERLKVEEWEEGRMSALRNQGWLAPKSLHG